MTDSSTDTPSVQDKFSDYKWCSPIEKALTDLNFEECTPIQSQAFPHLLAGKDFAGLAQTGTGKTAAFLLPLIERVIRTQQPSDDEVIAKRSFDSWDKGNFILVLVPTRELATQVSDNAKKFTAHTDMKTAAVFGGVGYDKQIELLKNNCEIVVGTPGRLIDLYKEGHVDVKQVKAIIFDEADRMFDMGFKSDMLYLLNRIPRDRQMLMFSATLNLDVMNVAYQFGAEPVEVDVSRDQATAENVVDKIFHVGTDEKPASLLALLKKYKPEQCIVFSNFKNNVGRISSFLTNNGLSALGISSLLNQSQRTKVMKQFKEENSHNIMVATDVAARGLDIKGVDMVINFELPDDAENYVHRIGRTGRAQSKGVAFSLVGEKDVDSLSRIESYLDKKLEIEWLEDEDLVTDFKPFPREDPTNRRPSSRGKTGPGGRKTSDRGERRPRKDFKEGDRKNSHSKPKPRRKYSEDRDKEKDESTSAAEPSAHRDRRTGRHKKRNKPDYSKKKSGERSHSEQNKKADSNKKPNSQSKRSKSRHKKAPNKQGLIGKVTSAIGSWFK